MQQVTAEDNTTSIFRVRSTLLFFFNGSSPFWQRSPFSFSVTKSSEAYHRKVMLTVHKQNAARTHMAMEVKLHAGARDWEGMVFSKIVIAKKMHVQHTV
jgi:hypothetical protein